MTMAEPSIEMKVREHTQRAFMLAQMDVRPPGYSVVAWACILMDDSYEKLETRYTKRVALEKAKVTEAASKAGMDGMFLEFSTPAVPATPPIEMVAKSMALYHKLAKELAEQACHRALVPFLGSSRSPEVMRQAAGAIRQCLDDLMQEQGQSFPRFACTLQMTKMTGGDGFLFTLTDARGR